jgi:hypothetical protein
MLAGDLRDLGGGEAVWHAHPVWFLDGNPIVGYSKLKECVRLLFAGKPRPRRCAVGD